jgi:predicted TIM-barrel fold metal-dependent hydrolase
VPGAVDVWFNVFTPDAFARSFAKYPELSDVFKWWHMEERLKGLSIEQFIQTLDEGRVAKVLIPCFQMASYQNRHMLMDFSPEDVAPLIEAVPGRVYGLYGINPWKRMDGVKEFERAVKELGFKGAHLHAYGFGLPISHRKFYPYYAKAAELGVPVIMQVGHSAEIMPSEMGRPILLDDLACDFPEVDFIGAHTGWPWVEELLALAWKHPRVHVATTMHRPRYWDEKLVQFINTRGQDKVMFGTDYPGLLPKVCMDDIDRMELKPEAKPKLLWENATRVFKL